MPDIVKALHSGRVLLMDGAMGTELMRAGVIAEDLGRWFGLARGMEKVTAVHRSYVEVGAHVLLTNSFLAGAQHMSWSMKASCVGGAIIARQNAGPERFVLLDSGPISDDHIRKRTGSLVLAAQEHQCDGILMETCSTIADASAVLAARQRKEIDPECMPVLLSWTFRREADGSLSTMTTHSPERCAKLAVKHGVAALGVNCGRAIAMPDILEIIRCYRSVTDLPLFVRPNAGTPKQIDGQWVYPETPESMAAWLPALFEAGVVMVGGCCGTTPAHIAAFRKVVDAWNSSHGLSDSEL